VQRIRSPWMTGIGEERRATDEKASEVMCWLVFSSTRLSLEYRLDPVTTMAQNKKGDKS